MPVCMASSCLNSAIKLIFCFVSPRRQVRSYSNVDQRNARLCDYSLQSGGRAAWAWAIIAAVPCCRVHLPEGRVNVLWIRSSRGWHKSQAAKVQPVWTGCAGRLVQITLLSLTVNFCGLPHLRSQFHDLVFCTCKRISRGTERSAKSVAVDVMQIFNLVTIQAQCFWLTLLLCLVHREAP